MSELRRPEKRGDTSSSRNGKEAYKRYVTAPPKMRRPEKREDTSGSRKGKGAYKST